MDDKKRAAANLTATKQYEFFESMWESRISFARLQRISRLFKEHQRTPAKRTGIQAQILTSAGAEQIRSVAVKRA